MAIAIKEQLQPWLERIDNLELRERILLLAATVAVMFLLTDTLVLQPTLKAQQVARQEIIDLEVKLNSLRQNAQLLSVQMDSDPTASRRQTRDLLTKELGDLDTQITTQLGALVEPAQAAQLLEQLLSSHTGLKLATLNASSEPLDDLELKQQTEAPGLARYQLDMVVRGGYLDLLNYLQSLEAMPWKFFWKQIDFQATEHPHAETRLLLYTLGAQDA
jgi:MSHA biogenesis protein MshJ